MAKCRIGTAKFFTLLLLLYRTSVKGAGYEIADIRKDLAHMLASAMFNGMFEVVMHDLSREDARQYILKLQEFFNAGWDKLLGL